MKVTLLKEKEVFGENSLIIVPSVISTDFGVATGVHLFDFDESAAYFLRNYEDNSGRNIKFYSDGYVFSIHILERYIGIRPVINFESIDEIYLYGEKISDTKVKFGMYADNALPKNEQSEWTIALSNETLKKCGKYTLDSAKYNDYDTPYRPIEYPIYEYKGKRAVRIKINSSYNGEAFKLFNGELYKDEDYVWFEVRDKIWNLDEKNLMIISENVMLGGLQFDYDIGKLIYEKDFFETNIGKYLNDVFLAELLQFSQPQYKFSNLNKDELLMIVYEQQKYIENLKNKIDNYNNNKELIKTINESPKDKSILALKPIE